MSLFHEFSVRDSASAGVEEGSVLEDSLLAALEVALRMADGRPVCLESISPYLESSAIEPAASPMMLMLKAKHLRAALLDFHQALGLDRLPH